MNESTILVFKAQTLIPVLTEARKNDCRIWLVKDHGIYIMSDKGQVNESGSRVNLCYATGCNPNEDELFYEKSVDFMGGDDSADSFDCHDEIFNHIIDKKLDLIIKVTPSNYELCVYN